MKTWKAKVQDTYSSLDELVGYDGIYGVAERCGFDNPVEMWEENPMIGGSVNPQDFGRIVGDE